MKNFSITGTYTDLYQLTMGQVYFMSGQSRHDAVFDYFFRKLPFDGGYVVFAGLYDVLEILEDFHFTEGDLDYLASLGFQKDYLNYLRGFRFAGTLYATREGDVVFPNQPVLRVDGGMLEAQIIETFLQNILNFESLIATKASRMRMVAGHKILSDFGLRRAQGSGGYHASRASIIGGFNSTSNVKAANDFKIPALGTMAHSFVQSHEDELSAFRNFAENRPENCVLLVDTYDSLKSGIPHAIMVAKEMEKKGHRLMGIRLDSGDLSYLSKQARHLLDQEGLHYVKISASNQLDEYVIKSLMDQQAPIDVFGVGTSLVTGSPDAALDGVYKLAYSHGKPRIKLSETLKKVTLPDKKKVFRVLDDNGLFMGADAVALEHEERVDIMYDPFEPIKSLSLQGMRQELLLQKVMDKGKIMIQKDPLSVISDYRQKRMDLLPDEYKRFEYPHLYKVGISSSLKKIREDLFFQYKG
jgi:nicotinate phosphoribosyltransferase